MTKISELGWDIWEILYAPGEMGSSDGRSQIYVAWWPQTFGDYTPGDASRLRKGVRSRAWFPEVFPPVASMFITRLSGSEPSV